MRKKGIKYGKIIDAKSTVRAIEKLLASGLTYELIAKKTGLSENSIRYLWKNTSVTQMTSTRIIALWKEVKEKNNDSKKPTPKAYITIDPIGQENDN